MTLPTDPNGPAPEENTRLATAADFDEIIALAQQLRENLTTQRGGPLWSAHDALAPPTPASLALRLTDPEVATVVGTLDGHVFAYGLAHTEPIRRGSATLGVIDELLVAESARAVGLGEILLAALVAWCTDAGATSVDATALPGDRTAKNFFESAGFKARRLIMHKAFTDPDAP